MVEESGTIVAINDGKILVETQVKSTCSGCQAKDNCGTSVIANAFSNKSDLLEYSCEEPVQVGQKVTLGIAEKTLLSASAMVYMLPLLTLLSSAILLSWLLPLLGLEHELWLVACAFIATFGSFVWVSAKLKQTHKCDYQPRLLKILPLEKPSIPIRQLSDPSD